MKNKHFQLIEYSFCRIFIETFFYFKRMSDWFYISRLETPHSILLKMAWIWEWCEVSLKYDKIGKCRPQFRIFCVFICYYKRHSWHYQRYYGICNSLWHYNWHSPFCINVHQSFYTKVSKYDKICLPKLVNVGLNSAFLRFYLFL